MTRRSRQRREARLLATLEGVITPRRRASLPALIWNWRRELAGLVCVATVWIAVAHALSIAWAIVVLSAIIGMLSPPWPQRLIAFVWHLLTPHLLRSGIYQARIQNRNGRRPFIVRVTREPFGERVRLWCPAGTSAEDLQAARAVLRAACWAADVRVTRDKRRSQIVILDVVRRREDFDPVA